MSTDIRNLVLPALLGLSIIALAIAIALAPAPDEREFISRSGYTLTYPGNWIVVEDEKIVQSNQELIREPRGHATISISVREEPRLIERSGRVSILNDIETGFFHDEAYRVDIFKWHDPDMGAENNGYIAAGKFVYDSVNFDFKEIGILEPAGKMTTFRTEVISAFAPELGPFVDASLRSIENKNPRPPLYTPLTSEQALNRVRALPSVILYGAEGLQEGRDFSLEVKEDGDAWTVRMFVSIKEGLNKREMPVQTWRVDKAMGVISKTVL